MKLFTVSDEKATETKSGLIFASKEELIIICEFFEKVKTYIESHDICHMHLQDNYTDWDKETDFDLEVNLKD